jgi:hypothetical protein
MSLTPPDGQPPDDDDDPRDRRPGDAPRGPERTPDLAELIRYLAVNLVDRPDEVRVEADLGKVIGRGGKTARALRTVVQAVAPRSRKRTLVEILE